MTTPMTTPMTTEMSASMTAEMADATTPVTRVLVTHGGHQFVTDMPLAVAARTYPWNSGYELRLVTGVDTCLGFLIHPDVVTPDPQTP